MAWVWTTVGLVGLVGALALGATAAALYAASPRRLQNRLVALFLALLAIEALGGQALMYLTDEPRDTFAWQQVANAAMLALLPVYLAFLTTLPAPVALRLAPLRPVLLSLGAAAPLGVLLMPLWFVVDVQPWSSAPWDVVGGAAMHATFAAWAGVSVLALTVAVAAYQATAPGSLARAQARAYVVAFAFLDLNALWTRSTIVILDAYPPWLAVTLPATNVVFALLLAYGVLKTQLFDLDLKVKLAVKRSTVVAAFGVTFLVASEVVERLLDVEGALVGVAAAVLLGLAFRRVEGLAQRVADATMPGVREDEAYAGERKREVYRMALAELTADGTVSDEERRVLEGLRARLGLGEEDARALERRHHVRDGAASKGGGLDAA